MTKAWMIEAWKVPSAVAADRAVGVVVASAAGDALGAGYEFGPPLSPGTPVEMVGGGVFDWAPGEWTDDTQMAWCMLSAFSSGRAEPTQVEAAFRRWFRGGPADVGNQTRLALSSSGSSAVAAARHFERHPGRAGGNGSLMRTGPVALVHPEDPDRIAAVARAMSALTHADPDCMDACVLWSVAIDHTIHHAPPPEVEWDWAAPLRKALHWLDADRRTRWAELIDEAIAGPPDRFVGNGWVVRAFQAAVAAIVATPVPDDEEAARHLRLALANAVRIGDDTDTVAAIAGSMLGARWGATAVPLAWRRILHGQGVERSERLSVADLERSARLAFSGGRPGHQGWPGCERMVPYYRRSLAPEPLLAELGRVMFGNAAALAHAIDSGADTVVSLCRMGTRDVPAGVEHHVLGLLDTTIEENPNLVLLLNDTIDALAAMVGEGRRVFVHCVAAANRTPTVAAAWLHRHGGHDPHSALELAAAALNRPRDFLAEAVARLEAPARPHP